MSNHQEVEGRNTHMSNDYFDNDDEEYDLPQYKPE